MQTTEAIIVGIIVLGAFLWGGIRVYRIITRPGCCGCKECGGCSGKCENCGEHEHGKKNESQDSDTPPSKL